MMMILLRLQLIQRATGTASSTSGSCTVTASETAGPFPTKTPSSLVTANIVSDRTGVGFSN